MQTRTHLTTPPGRSPVGGASPREDHEVYVPGLRLPEEPRPPGRHRTAWLTLASIVGLIVLVIAGFEYATRGQEFDPALDPAFQSDLPQDPAEPAPGLDTGDDGATDGETTTPGEGELPGDS